LGELGNASPNNAEYRGVAMTLIDSLDTLAIVGNHAAFARGVRWVGTNVSFDIDLRVNVFETNIRLLGGLLSAHLLASDPVRSS
jgi:mannosidase alpha-like ER degradation enhancer 1